MRELKRAGHAKLGDLMNRQAGNGLPGKDDVAAVGLQNAVDHVEQG